jgi:DNA-binding transcriptional LysR family regulator
MDQLHMLRAFVAAAQFRSFSKAAVALGMSCGSVSKAIAKLETHTGTRLLHRTTRSVTLTEEAQLYYCSCRRLLEELDEANRRLMHEKELASGPLRLVVHSMLIGDSLARLISMYNDLCPEVNLTVSMHDGFVNLYDGQYDIAVVPPDRVENSAVIRRTLVRSKKIFVASPGYLSSHSSLQKCADLSCHFLLLDPKVRKKGSDLIEVMEEMQPVRIAPLSSMDGNETTLRSAVLAGTGIAALPEMIVRQDIAQGRLVRVLPDCSTTECEVEICLFYTGRELLPARFRSFIDFCAEFFRFDPILGADGTQREIGWPDVLAA